VSAARPRFASVVLDVDSTVAGIEGLDWLAGRRGTDVAVRVAGLTDRAMRGEIALEQVYGERLALIRPTRDEVSALAQEYVRAVAPGARELIAHCREAGVRTALVSGGLREAREARHAVPSTMNERGARCRAAGGRKVSTDWAVPWRRLAEAIAAARLAADEAGVQQAVTYGHAGNGHPHQNFIARDAAELAQLEQVVERTLRTVIGMGGTVAAEHGIGKIKRKWLPLQLTPLQRSAMAAIKRELDPKGIMAPGNVL